jgi:DNA invertase Pin-like site-specific DNA recombinase
MISVMESLAQAENESRSENIRMGLAMRAASGDIRTLQKKTIWLYKE